MSSSMRNSIDADAPFKSLERRRVADVVASSHNESEFAVAGPSEDLPVCWICLDYATATQPLLHPCKCPRQAHPTCVARWQLQSAGTRKETHCEFCDGDLPDWKRTLTPQSGANAPAIMNVNFNDRTFSFEVKPGPDGYKTFTEAIRKAFGLPEDSELNITFTCDEPISNQSEPGSPSPPSPPVEAPVAPSTPPPSQGPPLDGLQTSPPSPTSAALLTLQGAGAYDAAVHCASVSAAKRLSQSPSPSPSRPHSQSPPAPSQRGHQVASSSMLGRPPPFSNIPGYSQHYPATPPPPGFSARDQAMPSPSPSPPPRLPRPFGARPAGFMGFAANVPLIEEPRMSSVPRRNNTSSLFQRASKAMKQGFRGGRKDRDDRPPQ